MIEIEQFVLKNFDKVKINSNNIELGDIFICLQGRNTHGNQYIEDAIIHGAKFIVTSKKIEGFIQPPPFCLFVFLLQLI